MEHAVLSPYDLQIAAGRGVYTQDAIACFDRGYLGLEFDPSVLQFNCYHAFSCKNDTR